MTILLSEKLNNSILIDNLKNKVSNLTVCLDNFPEADDEDLYITDDVANEIYDVLDKIDFKNTPPEFDLIADGSVSMNWCTSNMIGGIRFLGLRTNIGCYLRDGDNDILIKESVDINDIELINNINKIIDTYIMREKENELYK